MTEINSNNLYYERVKRAVAISRRRLLDITEVALKDSIQWEFVRKKIFQCFGNKGLDGLVDDIYGVDEENKGNV